jgi:hypothetical protein
VLLDWEKDGDQIALVCTDENIKALPPSLLSRLVASLFKQGAIVAPAANCIVAQADVVLLLRPKDGGAGARCMRLQQTGNSIVMSLTRRDGDSEAVARSWRLRAYTSLYCALESVLQLVFGSFAVKASVFCAKCKSWRTFEVCTVCFSALAGIEMWLPDQDDKMVVPLNGWATIASITVTAPKMRVVYFSASPLRTMRKDKLDKLDWKAGFDKVKGAANAIENKRVELDFQFHETGTLEQLETVLTADSSVPTILVIACHGAPTTGALQFADVVDGTVAIAVDAAKLTTALRRSKHKLALTVFSSCHSSLLAPAIQHVAQVPSFVTFGPDEVSVRDNSTAFLVELITELVKAAVGTPTSVVVERAKQNLLDRGVRSGGTLPAFASKIMWLPATHQTTVAAGAAQNHHVKA